MADKDKTGGQAAKDTPPKDTPPTPDAQVETEPEFTRERILDRVEGPKITGVEHHILVGALHDDTREKLTRDQVAKAVEDFYAHKEQ